MASALYHQLGGALGFCPVAADTAAFLAREDRASQLEDAREQRLAALALEYKTSTSFWEATGENANEQDGADMNALYAALVAGNAALALEHANAIFDRAAESNARFRLAGEELNIKRYATAA